MSDCISCDIAQAFATRSIAPSLAGGLTSEVRQFRAYKLIFARGHGLWDLNCQTQNLPYTYIEDLFFGLLDLLIRSSFLYEYRTWLIQVFTHIRLHLKATKASRLCQSQYCISRLKHIISVTQELDFTPFKPNIHLVRKPKMANHTSTLLLSRGVKHIVHSHHL
jgi:hypothetical protein